MDQPFRLDIRIAPAEVRRIAAAGYELCLLAPDAGAAATVWLALPVAERQVVRWGSAAELFVSQVAPLPGRVLVPHSRTRTGGLAEGSLWHLRSSVFSCAGSVAAGFAVRNEMARFRALTFGLAQAAEVNGQPLGPRPLAGTVLPPGFGSIFHLPASVVAFFAPRGSQSAVGALRAPGSLRLDFSRRCPDQRLVFQDGRWLAG
ncbi:hypothetical protein [Radicibacter daui]|uniref:hypothetical protein n=1 Tax=Radicibacter daui TaxID=3064829 RepID=UPI004046BCED